MKERQIVSAPTTSTYDGELPPIVDKLSTILEECFEACDVTLNFEWRRLTHNLLALLSPTDCIHICIASSCFARDSISQQPRPFQKYSISERYGGFDYLETRYFTRESEENFTKETPISRLSAVLRCPTKMCFVPSRIIL